MNDSFVSKPLRLECSLLTSNSLQSSFARFGQSLAVVLLALGLAHCETDSANSKTISKPNRPDSGLLRMAVTPAVPQIGPLRWHTASSPKLDSMIRAEWSKSKIGGRLGISVYSNKYNRTEVSINDTEFFTPAS